MICEVDLNNIIQKYLGTKYLFQGNSLDTGVDCANLCTMVSKDLGVTIPNINHIGFSIDTYSSLFKQRDNIKLWEVSEPKLGTLCVFRINGEVKHVGLMLNEYEFIHIMEGSRVTVDTLDSIQWKRRLVNCYKYVGNEETI